MPEKNYYELLDVGRNSGAELLREHYLERLYKFHPDHNPGNEDWAVTQTIELNKAYKVLDDPAARKMYDFKIGNAFRRQGQVKGMSLLKNKAKKDAEGYFEQGVRHHGSDDFPRAVESFKTALKLEPAFADAAYNLAYLGAVLGNAMFAMGILDKAIKADGKDESLKKLRRGIHDAFLNG
jgi:DnaJ-class molecular chaperone